MNRRRIASVIGGVVLAMVGGLKRNAATLLSYLLFERGYARALIRLGYKDTIARKDELAEFLHVAEPARPGAADAAAA